MTVRILHGDCMEQLRTLADESVHSVVTDPPYELGFMGKHWDGTGIANSVELWTECLRVLKPGGHLLSFGGSRTYHRMACAIEDAGFEIRDQIMWVYGSGFPKSLDVSKAIDKAAGAEREVIGARRAGIARASRAGGEMVGAECYEEFKQADITAPATEAARQWQGWGTALKPAHEPIVVARKPLIGTVAANVLKHGTGAINVDGCRIAHDEDCRMMAASQANIDNPSDKCRQAGRREAVLELKPGGRWPANLIHDGSDEVLAGFPDAISGWRNSDSGTDTAGASFSTSPQARTGNHFGDSGSAARFFYTAKASRDDRNIGCDDLEAKPLNWSSGTQSPGTFQSPNTDRSARNHHPTVKPTDLMQYLVRLVTPSGGTVLDPFAGSGSTGLAADREGFDAILIEREAEYVEIAKRRIRGDCPLFDALEAA